MKKIYLIIILLLVLSCVAYSASYKISASKGLEKYIPTVETQMGKPLSDIIMARKTAQKLLKDDDKLADDIVNLLGCKDKKSDVKVKIKYHYYDSNILITTLSNVKLVSYESVKNTKSLSTGYLNYEFLPNDKVNLVFSSLTNDGNESNFYLPILIDKSGNIIKKDEIIDGLIAIGGTNNLKATFLLRSVVDDTMKEMLGINFPFSRWYNEAMDYKVTSLVLAANDKALATEYDNVFKVTDESKKLKDKVNLWNYPQSYLIDAKSFSKDIDTANIQYSCELGDLLYQKIGAKGFYQLNTELKYSEFLTNTEMCKVINKLFNIDFEKDLYLYVPKSVTDLIKSNKTVNMMDEAEALINQDKWKEASTVLSSVLLINPYNYNARLNLARCYREAGDLLSSDKEIFITVGAMPPGQATISLMGKSNSNVAVIMGKYLFMSGSYGDALKFLETAYKYDPKAEDVKKTIDSIHVTMENMKKEQSNKG